MSYIGQPVKRFEDAPLVTGQGRFLDDLTLPGMLHAAVLRSDHAHATRMHQIFGVTWGDPGIRVGYVGVAATGLLLGGLFPLICG
ncbi:MAG: hypothetical protein IH962_01825, partial [Chloroflexi bacterium]|nr:hypothetical protein [Chloroflexota bacterium]